ncbi:MAG: GNAT family N-acetyltransferase [Burkholderiaceae bacterium]
MILRPATLSDVPALDVLIVDSGIALSRGFYSDGQAQAITRQIFGVDTQLIHDGSYFVIEDDGMLVACGGWSRRGTLFGRDHAMGAHGSGDSAWPDPLLDPAVDAARIRAFFVAPGQARRGLGSRLMRHCAAEAWHAGFRGLTLVGTMPGVPLYEAFGFAVDERFDLPLESGIRVPLATMSRALPRPALD